MARTDPQQNLFDSLTPLYPLARVKMETVPENISGRVMDLFRPPAKASERTDCRPAGTGKKM